MGIIDRFFRKSIDEKANRIASEKVNESVHKIKAQLGIGGYYGLMGYGNAGGNKYPWGLSASGAGRVLDHYTLRRNARDAYHDTPQVKSIVDRYADTVADTGLMLEAIPKAEILGITREQAEVWAMDVEERFDCWARSKKQHRAENMNWYQTHRLYQIFQQRDNDIFTRLYYSQDRNLTNPLQFQFIDPDQIRGDSYTTTWGYKASNDGIIRDERGREKKYKIWAMSPKEDGKFEMFTIPAKGPKSGRIFMLHGFMPEYAGQMRGYSRLSHTLQEFENLTDFNLAHIKKAINQSNTNLYVKPSPDEPASNPFEDIMTHHGAGPAALQYGEDPCPAGDASNVTPESLQPVNFCEIPEATMGPAGVGVFNLNKGEDLKAFENNSPMQEYGAFVDAFTSHLAASMSIPVEVVLMKFNQNYSASRASLILFWRVAEIFRQEMAADYLDPTYTMWLSEEIASGRVTAAGWMNPIMKAAWLNTRWIGSSLPSIDPSKTAKADKEYVEMGAQTLDRVARNLNSSSGAANRAKLRRELADLPPVPWTKEAGGGSNPTTQGSKE